MIKEPNVKSDGKTTRVLVAPLDWGLGHATRCIPIIRELIKRDVVVFIAAGGQVFDLLNKEFPSCVFLRFPGYKIKYSRQKQIFFLKLLTQAPKVLLRIIMEKKWLKQIVSNYSIDAVISDNRFGMFNKNIRSVYITHQLFIKTGNRFSEKIAQRIHYFFIKKFDQCWVPDFATNGLAGELSHPKTKPSNIIYIGPLSRIETKPAVETPLQLLVILSGPEPQRTIFEKIILVQLQSFRGNVVLVRGLPSIAKKPDNFNNITVENYADSTRLSELMAAAEMIVTRSGYTSVMDLAIMQKKAIVIPTPGQTEQEYLAGYLLSKKYFFSVQQKAFQFEVALNEAENFPFQHPHFERNGYKKTIEAFVRSLKSGIFANQ